jgi:hypothetical protein
LLNQNIIIIDFWRHYFKTDIVHAKNLDYGCTLCEIWEFHCRGMAIFTKFLNFVMFGTLDLEPNGTFTISINHHTCPISQAENNLLNFVPFIGPIMTLCEPTSFAFKVAFIILSLSAAHMKEQSLIYVNVVDWCYHGTSGIEWIYDISVP